MLWAGLRLTVALLLLANTGCTSWREYVHNGYKVGPNYCKPNAAVADHWIDDANPNVSSEPCNVVRWWETFSDPTLNDLVETAYRQNLTLRIAGQRIMEAQAQKAIVVGNLFPQSQSLDGSYQRYQLSKNAATTTPGFYNYNDIQLGGNLSWELDFWGRFRRAVTAADATLDASIYNYDDALVLLLSQVAQSYDNLRTAEQRLVYARKNVKDQQESLNLATVKFGNGATTKLDVTQGESNLGQTEATIPPLEATRRQSANQLCILMGMPPRDLETMLGKHSIPTASPKVVLGIPADLLRRRPDIRAAERQLAAQSEQIGIATAELYPHFSITGSIYLDSENFKNLFNSDSLAGSVGPTFQWNVLNYGRLLNGVRYQKAKFEELAYYYQNTVLNANAEVENAVVGFLQAQEQVKSLAVSVKASQESLDLVRTQYNEGKTDFNRVLTVEQNLTQQEDQWAVAQGSVATNLISVYKALGGGWQMRLNETQTANLPAQPDSKSSPKAGSVKAPADESAEEPVAVPPEAPAASPDKPAAKPAKKAAKSTDHRNAPAELPDPSAAKAIDKAANPAKNAKTQDAAEDLSVQIPSELTPSRNSADHATTVSWVN